VIARHWPALLAVADSSRRLQWAGPFAALAESDLLASPELALQLAETGWALQRLVVAFVG